MYIAHFNLQNNDTECSGAALTTGWRCLLYDLHNSSRSLASTTHSKQNVMKLKSVYIMNEATLSCLVKNRTRAQQRQWIDVYQKCSAFKSLTGLHYNYIDLYSDIYIVI